MQFRNTVLPFGFSIPLTNALLIASTSEQYGAWDIQSVSSFMRFRSGRISTCTRSHFERERRVGARGLQYAYFNTHACRPGPPPGPPTRRRRRIFEITQKLGCALPFLRALAEWMQD